jgi:hypothetical protein
MQKNQFQNLGIVLQITSHEIFSSKGERDKCGQIVIV